MRLSKEELDDVLKRNPDITAHVADSKGYGATVIVVKDTPKRSKYGAIKTEYNGIKYDSKAEARWAENFDMEKRAGDVLYWLRQVPFFLPAGIIYRCDFQVFYTSGVVKYFDVKGWDTPVSKLKRKQVEALYPVKIQVVK